MQRELISALKPLPALPPRNHPSIEHVLTLVPPASEPSALTKRSGNGAHSHRCQILCFVKAKHRSGSNCIAARPSPLVCTMWTTGLVQPALLARMPAEKSPLPTLHVPWAPRPRVLPASSPCTTAETVIAPLPSQRQCCQTPTTNPLLLSKLHLTM